LKRKIQASSEYQHIARITEPDIYVRLRNVWDALGDGIGVNYGVKDDGTEEIQSITFGSNTYTKDQAKSWLEKNGYTVIEFEPATDEIDAAGGYERVVEAKPILRLGEFDASTGLFKVTSKRLSDCIFGINSRFVQETPVGLKYTHAKGVQSVTIGYMNNAKELDGGSGVSDLHITEDAAGDLGDGLGSRTLATIDQIADQLEKNLLRLSIEGNYNAKRKGYYEGRTLALEPVAWAVLPVDVLPAMPQVAAGGEKVDVVCIIAEQEEQKVNEKELKERIEVLEKENKDLLKKISDTEAAAADKAAKAEKAEIEASTKKVAGKLASGKREAFIKRVEAKDSPAEKRAVLAETQALIKDGVIAALTPNDEILGTGNEGDTDTFHANADKREAHVEALMKEDPEMDRVEAELKSTFKKPDLWKGIKE
jgi:hypothetical protein